MKKLLSLSLLGLNLASGLALAANSLPGPAVNPGAVGITNLSSTFYDIGLVCSKKGTERTIYYGHYNKQQGIQGAYHYDKNTINDLCKDTDVTVQIAADGGQYQKGICKVTHYDPSKVLNFILESDPAGLKCITVR